MRSIRSFLLSFILLSATLLIGSAEEHALGNQVAQSAEWNELMRQANAFLREGRVAEAAGALDTLIRGARIRGEGGAEIAKALNDLGTLYHDLDRLRDAERCYAEAIRILEHCSCLEKTLAIALSNLANLRQRERRYSDAQKLYRRAEQLTATVFGSGSPEIAVVYTQLAEMSLMRGRYGEARELGARALSLLENSVKDSRLGFALAVLGKVAWHERQFDEAEGFFRRSIAAWRVSVGPNHESYASGLAGLAELVSPRKPDEADELFRHALTILEARLGPSHGHTASTMLLYSIHLQSQGRKVEAKALKRRAELTLAKQARQNQLGLTVDVQTLAPLR